MCLQMGKEIAVLLGSPRKGGNTEQMADAFIRGAERAGHHAVKNLCRRHKGGLCCLRRVLFL